MACPAEPVPGVWWAMSHTPRLPPLLTCVLLLASAGCGPELAADADEPSAAREALYQGPDAAKWPGGLVPVCFTSMGTSLEAAWLKDALARSWSAWANVGFTYLDSCRGVLETSTTVRVAFLAVDHANWGSRGRAAIGYAPNRWALLWYCAPGNPTGCLPGGPMAADYEESFRAVVVHEFGHILGFIHEQQRPDATPNCPLQMDEQSVTIENGFYLSSRYDPDSIMNYCRGWDGARPLPYQLGYRGADRLSHGDIEGVRAAYGPRRMTATATPPRVPPGVASQVTLTAVDAFGAPVQNASVYLDGVRLGALGQPVTLPPLGSCVWEPATCEWGRCTKPRLVCDDRTTLRLEVRANAFTPGFVLIRTTP